MAVFRKGTYPIEVILIIGLLIIVVLGIVIVASMSSGAVRESTPLVELLPKIKACKDAFSIACLKALFGW